MPFGWKSCASSIPKLLEGKKRTEEKKSGIFLFTLGAVFVAVAVGVVVTIVVVTIAVVVAVVVAVAVAIAYPR